jgi:hypothetical protein
MNYLKNNDVDILLTSKTGSLDFIRLPAIFFLLEFGSANLCTKLFCLSFDVNVPIFYFNYINYFGLLIFCCQIVAISLYPLRWQMATPI